MDQARLRPAQVGASTAAAVGGAFLATRLGVYGTIIGVGVITLMSTVGSEMLLRSLERTKQAARLANLRQRPSGTTYAAETSTATVQLRTTDQAAAAEPVHPADAETVETPGTVVPAEPPTRTTEPATATEQPITTEFAEQPAEPRDPPQTARRWPLVAGGFLASFGLALAVIVGIETVTGRSIDGDGSPSVVTVLRGAGEGSEDEPRIPATPTDEPTTPAPDDGTGTTSDSDSQRDGTAPDPEPSTPPQEPAPQDDEAPAPQDEEDPAAEESESPPDDETPTPDEETSTPPSDEETPAPEEESTPAQ